MKPASQPLTTDQKEKLAKLKIAVCETTHIEVRRFDSPEQTHEVTLARKLYCHQSKELLPNTPDHLISQTIDKHPSTCSRAVTQIWKYLRTRHDVIAYVNNIRIQAAAL